MSAKNRAPDSEETRKKKSVANKGKILSEESRKKISYANRGRLVSLETRIKISVAGKGKIKSESHKQKIGDANKGKIIADITRKKISKSNKGKIRTIETCKKMSKSRKEEGNNFFGKKHSYETRAIIIEDRIGGFWYGNVRNDYTISQLIRSHVKSRNYTTSILDRDQYKDFYTKEPCKYPEVHHIIKLKDIVKKYNIKTLDEAIACEPLWDTNNGITLEKRNHAQWHRCHDKFEYINKEDIDKLYE